MVNLNDRILYIRKNNKIKPNISEYEFAKALGTYPVKFAEIRSGKVKTISPEIALEISNVYNVNFKWLLTGIGEPFTNPDNSNCYDIPIRGDVEGACGYGVTVYNENQTATYSISRKFANDLGINPKKSEIIFARGDSMEPNIKGGDSLLVDLSKKEILDGVIYCIRIDGQLLIKRLQRLSKNVVAIISDNPKYTVRKVSLDNNIDDFEIIGEIRWCGRITI